MINAICTEIRERKGYITEIVSSIYVGGGTPSLLTQEELKCILSTIHANFSIANNAEITLEANPDDISSNALSAWKELGFNRLSIGIQSFRKKDLEWMNRAHSVAEAKTCVQIARAAGFDVLSVDLIYGLPGLTNIEWEAHLQQVIDWDVSHISAYCLTIEERTVLDKLVKTQKIIPSKEEDQSEQFELLTNMLQKNGYEHYEISNFAKPGYHAVHNSNYWKGIPYLGVGPSAHSFNGFSRRWNCSNNNTYMQMEKDVWFDEELLGDSERWNELLLTGLRTSFGVNLTQLFTISAPTVRFERKLAEFIELKLIEQKDTTVYLTTAGRLQADHIASELFL